METKIHFLKSNLQFLFIAVFLLSFGLSSCEKDSDEEEMTEIDYSGSFVKSKDEVVTSATGTVTASYDVETMKLSYSVSWSGLSSNVANMHFHNNGPVMVGIEGYPTTTSGTVTGMVSLTTEQANDLAAGKIYVQIHTANYPPGEVIATLTKSNN